MAARPSTYPLGVNRGGLTARNHNRVGQVEYRVVFDVTSAGYSGWSFPAVGLAFVAIGWAGLRGYIPGWGGKRQSRGHAVAFVFFCFAVLWTGVVSVVTYRNHAQLYAAQTSNRVGVVEGIATNVKTSRIFGHPNESFCVSGKCFAYSDNVITGGFNTTISHGGPMIEGLPVRVSYAGDLITKLEVPK
jgi:hypothetical protein